MERKSHPQSTILHLPGPAAGVPARVSSLVIFPLDKKPDAEESENYENQKSLCVTHSHHGSIVRLRKNEYETGIGECRPQSAPAKA